MKIYSPERKAAVIAKMLSPNKQPIAQIARQEDIPINTLYAWRTQACPSSAAQSVNPTDDNLPQEWSQGARFAALIETAPLSAHAVAEYCRCRKRVFLSDGLRLTEFGRAGK